MTNVNAAFDALGDGTRRTILAGLAAGPKHVAELAAGLPVTRPAVSQHLKILMKAGLVTAQAEGTRRLYRLDPAGIAAVRGWLDGFWNETLRAYAAEVASAAKEDGK